jgi:hypothetical protein
MDLFEIEEQENLLEVLSRTLQSVWERELGSTVRVSPDSSPGSQEWKMTPRLAAMFTSPTSKAARRFMADRFRFTEKRLRLPAQWVLGTALASPPVLQRATPAFYVAPPIPDASDVIVVPGSRRIRIFDFAAGTTTSHIKEGYAKDAVRTEVELRSAGNGPYPPLLDYDIGQGWFKEEILPGYTLPRLPPWWNRAALESSVLQDLKEWIDGSVVGHPRADYLEKMHGRAAELVEELHRIFPSSLLPLRLEQIHELARLSKDGSELSLSRTHGDLQPGNIHVTPARRGYILDWEFCGTRERCFDFLTYGLRVRSGSGLAKRVQAFVEHSELLISTHFISESDTERDRKAMTSLFLLEEVVRATEATLSSPFEQPPLGFRVFCKELSAIVG